MAQRCEIQMRPACFGLLSRLTPGISAPSAGVTENFSNNAEISRAGSLARASMPRMAVNTDGLAEIDASGTLAPTPLERTQYSDQTARPRVVRITQLTQPAALSYSALTDATELRFSTEHSPEPIPNELTYRWNLGGDGCFSHQPYPFGPSINLSHCPDWKTRY